MTSYFVLSSLQVREKKQGGQYLALIVSDKTGSLEARMWDDVADAIASLLGGLLRQGAGGHLEVQGQVSDHAEEDAVGGGVGD